MTIAELQERVGAFAAAKGISNRAEIRIMDLASELGELTKED